MNPQPRSFTLRQLPGHFAILRFAPETPIPAWALSGDFFSITRTDDELSIVCRQPLAPAHTTCSPDWACLKLIGPFAFDDTGIVAAITRVIAEAGAGVFVISTFDGDHLLVKHTDLARTAAALRNAGHVLHSASPQP